MLTWTLKKSRKLIRFEENNQTEPINSTNKTKIKENAFDYKVNVTTLKKLVKLPSLCKRHTGNLGNKILSSKKKFSRQVEEKNEQN